MVNKKVAAFRVDASREIGSGHIMRCLTLANLLRDEGWSTYFVCQNRPGQMSEILKDAGHFVHLLDHGISTEIGVEPQSEYARWLGVSQADDADATRRFLKLLDVDWIVVDHYALDSVWESAIGSHCKNLMVIDDLANRKHQCDLLLDQTHGRVAADYSEFTPKGARILCGASYALLRPEFKAMRDISLRNKTCETVGHILVSMGGSDPDNITQDILSVMSDLPVPTGCKVTVVVGAQSQHLDSIVNYASTMPFPCQVLSNVTDMAALMASCDLAIGAAGSTSWERCCLGLPCIMIVLADNQKLVARNLENIGAAFIVDAADRIKFEIPRQLNLLLSDRKMRIAMSERASCIVDGDGRERVLFMMEEIDAG